MALKPVGARLILEGQTSFIGGMRKASGSVDAFERNIKGAGVGTIALGTALGNLATGGLRIVARAFGNVARAGAGFLGDSVKQAADLEFQMSGVQAVLGATDDELTTLKELVSDLGLDPNLKVSSLEAAQAIEVLAKNGLDIQDIMSGAARSTVALANATGADFAVAADVATDAMNQFGIDAGNMETAIDGITGVVTNSKFDINDYRLAIGNAGKIVANTGISFGDFNTALVASADAFTSGSDAGTSLKTAMQRLSNPTDEAKGLMDELGISLFDADGNTRDLSEVVGQLNDAFSNMTQEQQAQTAAVLGGSDASRTFLALAGLTEEQFVALRTEVNKTGQAQFSAATRVDNLAGAMDILDGIVEAVKISIGDEFLPILTDMTRKVSEFLEANSEPFIAFFENVASGIAKFIDGLTSGLSPLQAFIGAISDFLPEETITNIRTFISTFNEMVASIVTFVTDHSGAFQGALIAIGAILAGAAIAAGITAIAGAIAALLSPIGLLIAASAAIGLAWQNNWLGIRDITQSVIDIAIGLIGDLKTFWAENSEAILAKAQEVWSLIESFIGGIWDTIVLEFQAFKALFQGDFEGFGENIQLAWETAWNNVVSFTAGLFALVQPFLSSFFASVSDWFGSQDWEEVGLTVGEKIGQGARAISDFVTITLPKFGADVLNFFKNFKWEDLGITLTDGFGQGILDGLKNVLDTIGKFIKGVIAGFKEGFETGSPSKVLAKIGVDVVLGLINGILSKLNAAIDAAKDIVSGIIKAFKDKISEFVSIGADMMAGLISGIKAKAGSIADAAKDAVGNAVDAAKNALGIGSPSKVFIGIGEDIGAGLSLGIQSGGIKATEALLDLAGELISIGSSFGGLLQARRVDPLTSELDRIRSIIEDEQQGILDLLGLEDAAEAGGFGAIGLRITMGDIIDPTVIGMFEALNVAQMERAQIEERIRVENEKLLALQEKQSQLGFLQSQLDLLKLVREEGLDPANILGGLQLGLEADEGGLLEAMTRATQSLIDRANEELQIGSPSKVFMRIGQQVSQGLLAGLSGDLNPPAGARQINNQAINNISNRTININYSNNSGLPLNDANELNFLLGSYA